MDFFQLKFASGEKIVILKKQFVNSFTDFFSKFCVAKKTEENVFYEYFTKLKKKKL